MFSSWMYAGTPPASRRNRSMWASSGLLNVPTVSMVESDRRPAGKDPLRGSGLGQPEQFSQESDERLHGRDDTTGFFVSKVFAFPLPEPRKIGSLPKKHRAVGVMIRKNKETDPPAARVAALTESFDQSGWQSFKLSSPRVAWLSGEQLESKLSPCRVHKRGHDAGESEQGEDGERDERENHGEFAVPGSGAVATGFDILNPQTFIPTMSGRAIRPASSRPRYGL